MIAPAARKSVVVTWSLVGRFLPVLVAGVLIYLLAHSFANKEMLEGWPRMLVALTLCAVIYLCGHGFRILRLALLIGGWRLGFRDVASYHLTTAAFAVTVPLAWGELYRTIELSQLTNAFLRSVVMIWCLRFFDTAAILVMLALALASSTAGATEFDRVALVAVAFVAATAIAVFIVPHNLRRLAILIIRRYDSPQAVRVLKAVDALRRAHQEVPDLLKGKVASLVTLTALVWACEIAAFAIAVPPAHGAMNAAFDGLLTFLSAVTNGETLFGAIGRVSSATLPEQIVYYLSATQVPLVVIGLLSSIHYIRLRLGS